MLAAADELELRLDVRKRLRDDAPLVGVGLVPFAPERGTSALRVGELLQLLEREIEKVAQPRQLADALDVLVAVEPVRAARPLDAREQPELLVVTDRARRDAR